MHLTTLILIGLGSFIGGVFRYLVSLALQGKGPMNFPWGTLVVNLAGSFLIGYAYHYSRITTLSPEWRLFFITGILGGFTTFSAFSIETFGMAERGEWPLAIAYAGTSVILGLLAAWLGASTGTAH